MSQFDSPESASSDSPCIRSDKRSSYQIYKLASERANACLDTFLLTATNNDTAVSSAGAKDHPPSGGNHYSEEERLQISQRCRQLRRRHASSNFTYGDTRFDDFQEILKRLLSISYSSLVSDRGSCNIGIGNEVFVDLGCGIGECLFAAALLQDTDLITTSCSDDDSRLNVDDMEQQPITAATKGGVSSLNRSKAAFRKVIGVDLMCSKIEECRMTWHMIQEIVNNDTTTSISLPTKLQILEEDFFEIDVSDTTIIYACATCFSQDTIQHIAKAGLQMRSGGKLIILDKPLDYSDNESSNSNSNSSSDSSRYCLEYELLFTHQCKTSWGTGVAYVYQRK